MLKRVNMASNALCAVPVALMGFMVVVPDEGKATSKYMLAVLDASGSMSIERNGGGTRWDVARERATRRIRIAMQSSAFSFSVWTFQNSTVTHQTVRYVSGQEALDAIDSLQAPAGTTPLASAICDGVDSLMAICPGCGPANRVLALASDGEENNTPSSNRCHGPASVDAIKPFTKGSWQNKVYQAVHGVVIHVDVLGNYISKAARVEVDDDRSKARSSRGPTILEFFEALTAGHVPRTRSGGGGGGTGGSVTVIDDSRRPPVDGDLNADGCVDDDDLNLVGQYYDQTVPPADGRADSNSDGVVDYADYEYVLGQMGGGCAQ